jgi:hypothetical protein
MDPLPFKVGDLVTRDGTDVHRVVDMNEHGDLMEVECVKEPAGFRNEDGTRAEPWVRVGEREWNLPRRYEHAGEIIDAVPVKDAAIRLQAPAAHTPFDDSRN